MTGLRSGGMGTTHDASRDEQPFVFANPFVNFLAFFAGFTFARATLYPVVERFVLESWPGMSHGAQDFMVGATIGGVGGAVGVLGLVVLHRLRRKYATR